jgi:hypothetical protein
MATEEETKFGSRYLRVDDIALNESADPQLY